MENQKAIIRSKFEAIIFNSIENLGTKNASRLRVERGGDMESEEQSDSGVEHGNDLCRYAQGIGAL